MNVPSQPIQAHKSSIKAAIDHKDVSGLVAQAEALMRWQQSDNDEEKAEAAALLDEIASHLLRFREYGAARMVVMGSLRVKGTMGKESGLTTFSYQQLEECDRAADMNGSPTEPAAGRQVTFWSANSRVMLIVALLAVASAWGVFVLLVK
jgi:hypothetical protein